jgi:hypothetical protein
MDCLTVSAAAPAAISTPPAHCILKISANERLLLMCGTIVDRMKMEQSEGCGARFLPKIFLQHVGNRINVPDYEFQQMLCPE